MKIVSFEIIQCFRLSQTRVASERGFSLVELLLVLVVIGVVSAVAFPSISKVNQGAVDTADQRNAQSLVSLFHTAEAAGVEFLEPGNVVLTLQNMAEGAYASEGISAGAWFGFRGLTEEQLNGAARFIQLTDQKLVYTQREVPVAASHYGTMTLTDKPHHVGRVGSHSRSVGSDLGYIAHAKPSGSSWDLNYVTGQVFVYDSDYHIVGDFKNVAGYAIDNATGVVQLFDSEGNLLGELLDDGKGGWKVMKF
ncbi:MAG: prepilin-type N-terminal cleavage/methylation domain-containing protein [Verrucomicrobiota bacterium]